MIRLDGGTSWIELWLAPRGDGTFDVMRRHGRTGQPLAAAVVEALPLDGKPAKAVYDDIVRRYTHDGARQRAAVLPDEPREPDLEGALPDAATALVYGDWLQARGHPRGRLIAIDAALAADPTSAVLAAERARMLHDHADVLLGELALWFPDPGDDGGLTVTWDHGFLVGARFDRAFYILGAIEALFRHPSARALRELVIGRHDHGDQNNTRVCEYILYSSPAPPLRRLYIGDFDDSFEDGIDISRAPIGDLTELGEIFPLLEDVALKGRGDVVLGNLALPRCRRFALRTSTMTRATLAAILAAPWPVLAELELWFGDPTRGYGAEIADPAPLAPLFDRPPPNLRTLRLMNAPFVPALIAELARSRLAAQIELLDLSLGAAVDDDARALAMRQPAFPQLRTVRFVETAVTDAGLDRLRLAGLTVDDASVCPARTPPHHRGRYTAVNE